MTSRNHHYVPQWYQEGFLEPGRDKLEYLDLQPARIELPDGRRFTHRSRRSWTAAQCFFEHDLYSTRFGPFLNDEIERLLFGSIDTRGARAVRAFTTDDQGEWHRNFEPFFIYIDAQKLRTPKGLDWVRQRYPDLTQNELLFEMQAIRLMHGTIWTEGVREIVSAEQSETKFILSDHPVTIYNRGAAPGSELCRYPNDPPITLKGSQTIFPLNRDFCLILTNLEYAKNPSVDPLSKRTFARHFRSSLVNTIEFIRSRKLSAPQVAAINYVIKARARRYIAAGRSGWLYPEGAVGTDWPTLAEVVRPPEDHLWHFGGEIYARFESGDVHYQDAFGRTEPDRPFLKKNTDERKLRGGSACGCGSGKAYRDCCKLRPARLRRSWTEASIRERNLGLLNAVSHVLGLGDDFDWVTARRELTNERIAKLYRIFSSLWSTETDILSLLPKPDGRHRAVYAGPLHPETISDFALGSPLYLGEVLVEHPFIHPAPMAPEFSPLEKPGTYQHEIIKAVIFFMMVMPLVEAGLIDLVPDPCSFDQHLHRSMLEMARARLPAMEADDKAEPRLKRLMKEDMKRTLMCLPDDALRRQIQRTSPELADGELDQMVEGTRLLREQDPYAPLRDDVLDGDGGQFMVSRLAPNFEIAMYLAQATGASLITDSPIRWKEWRSAQRPGPMLSPALIEFTRSIEESRFLVPRRPDHVLELRASKSFKEYEALFADVYRYIRQLGVKPPKPNFEAQLSKRFIGIHRSAQKSLSQLRGPLVEGRIRCLLAPGGLQHNTVNRLLLMSSSEAHTSSVPIAFFFEALSDKLDPIRQKSQATHL